MIKEARQPSKYLTLKCECTIFHNNLQLNSKKKSKLSSIELRDNNKVLLITPKGEADIYEMRIQKLKIIHKKFIAEGKITLQFDGLTIKEANGLQSLKPTIEVEKRQSFHTGGTVKNLEGSCQIFINNGSKQNLQLMIQLLIQAKKKATGKSQAALEEKNKINEEDVKKKAKKQQFTTSIYKQQEKGPSRKDLQKIIKTFNNPIKTSAIAPKPKKQQKPIKPALTLVNLPQILLKEIFSFSGIHLNHRLISKSLQKFVLMNVSHLKLKDEIDQQSFNKIAKYAISVVCRMKNIKNLSLVDRYDEPELKENRAKRLNFEEWKQINAKNINQLKGLKIYSLSVNYNIKFDFSNFYGLRLVELRLIGTNVISKNSYIKDQQILYMVNNINVLKVIQIAFISTKFIMEIKEPKKLSELKIGILNVMHSSDKWADFSKFENLSIFRINQIYQNSIKDYSSIFNVIWPFKCTTLETGFSLTRESLRSFPMTLINLKVNGQFYRNEHFQEIYLPSLNFLDISEAMNLSPQFLEDYQNIRVLSSWDYAKTDYANKHFSNQNIQIASTRCYTIYN